MTSADHDVQTNNHLEALTVLTENITHATQKIALLYQQQNLYLEPQDFIYIYCCWLKFIVTEKITGNGEHIINLIIETIQNNEEQGSNLCVMVKSRSDQIISQADTLVNEYGLIVMPVLKLMRFISETIQTMLNNNPKNHIHEKLNKNFTDKPMQDIFEDTFQTTVLAINDFGIPNPLIFLLENFSIIIGWLAGFFAKLNNKPTEVFLEKSILYLKDINKK